MNLTKEQYEIVKQGVGPTAEKGRRFTRLTGKMLRALIDNGGVVLPKPSTDGAIDFAVDYPDELFKGVENEVGLAFLESHLRFFAQGWLDAAKNGGTFIIDTIWGAKQVKGFGRVTVTFLAPKLTKRESLDFANTFHRADEFDLQENYARAWYD